MKKIMKELKIKMNLIDKSYQNLMEILNESSGVMDEHAWRKLKGK